MRRQNKELYGLLYVDPLPFYIIGTNSCQPSIKEVVLGRGQLRKVV